MSLRCIIRAHHGCVAELSKSKFFERRNSACHKGKSGFVEGGTHEDDH